MSTNDANAEHRAHLEKLIATNTERLRELEVRVARQGHNSPAELTIEIAAIQRTLVDLGTQLQLHPPLNRRDLSMPTALAPAATLFRSTLSEDERKVFDFVSWCELVLRTLFNAGQALSVARVNGVHADHIANTLFGQSPDAQAQIAAVVQALEDWQAMGYTRHERIRDVWYVTPLGRRYESEYEVLWQTICRHQLSRSQANMLSALQVPDPPIASAYAYTQWVYIKAMDDTVDPDAMDLLWAALLELQDEHYMVQCQKIEGDRMVRITLYGKIWDTRRSWFDPRWIT